MSTYDLSRYNHLIGCTGRPEPERSGTADIELKPYVDPTTGEVVYGGVISSAISGGGSLVPQSDANDGSDPATPISTLPNERMAGDWDEIANELRRKEQGGGTATDLVLRPGGGVEQVPSGRLGDLSEATPVSTLPEQRMAAIVGPSSADAAEIRRLDPTNRENWAPQYRGEFAGWSFELSPPFRSQGRFKFLIFRSPADGNRLRISPLYPNRDHLYGHSPHMISVRLGGYEVPVICGPGGRSAANFTQARGDAAKWMIYTSYQLAGRRPPFSE